MESREMIISAVETPSSYELGMSTNSPPTHTANPNPMTGPHGFSLAKKKRGRPRKYGPDGTPSSGHQKLTPLSSSRSPPEGAGGELAGSSGEFQKKKRKIYSYEKSLLSLGDQITSGGSFTPHMVTVNPGEDVTSKIISFSKYGPRAICVLSALGIISHVTLRQANSSGGTVTYEGRFEILSLSGSFTPGAGGGEVGIITSRGGMSITLCSPDGRVVGGLLGGLLTAAAPVQVVVASFLPDVNPVGPKPRNAMKLLTPPMSMNPEHEHESPTTGNTNSTPAPNSQHETMPSVHDWRRSATDMNVSLRED